MSAVIRPPEARRPLCHDSFHAEAGHAAEQLRAFRSREGHPQDVLHA